MSSLDEAGTDRPVAALLARAGLTLSPAALRDLLRGVLAAPPGYDPDGWLDLLPVPREGEVADALRALKASLEAVAEGSTGRPGTVDRLEGRLERLRGRLAQQGLDAFLVPRADEHQGEYVPLRAQRLAWLTGFTGSAGLAVVMAERAALFVDGRYTLQVAAEVDGALFEFRHLIEDPLSDWLIGALPKGARVGFDPWLHTAAWVEKQREPLERAGIALVACPENPLDAVWPDQPPPPLAPVVPHPPAFAGRSSAEKRAEIAARLTRDGLAAAVLTQPDSLAWLLNIRGGDVACTPLPLAFALLHGDATVDLFVDRRKLVPGLAGHLGAEVRVQPPEALAGALDALGRAGAAVLADPGSAAAWIVDRLLTAGARLVRDADPCMLPKACKNPVELEGARAAHRRDGVAMVRFLSWLSRTAPAGTLTESAAAARLEAFRAEGQGYRGPSFETISGAGPNGAIVHYRVSPATDRVLADGSLYLLDSGGQYLDGTTDVTRTLAIGTPTAQMCRHFTLVLKGHIALASARFPAGTTGSQLDALARQPLWQAGLDYDHGTGHGVGSFLSVHEGPQRIAKAHGTAALKPGMILSDEPGYYLTGAYGIRIENLLAVESTPAEPAPGRPFLGFEVLTLVPIDRALIEPALLTVSERQWLDAYHARVQAELAPLLDAESTGWMAAATAPLGV